MFDDMNDVELEEYAAEEHRIAEEHKSHSVNAYAERRRRIKDGTTEKANLVDIKVLHGQDVTRGEIDELGFEVIWSICYDTSGDSCDWICDFNAPDGLADGIYDVSGYGWDSSEFEIISGIEILGGRFVPSKTMKAIQNLMRILGDLHHCFIEGLDWTGSYFKLSMGS